MQEIFSFPTGWSFIFNYINIFWSYLLKSSALGDVSYASVVLCCGCENVVRLICLEQFEPCRKTELVQIVDY